jgi:hypothetical protein
MHDGGVASTNPNSTFRASRNCVVLFTRGPFVFHRSDNRFRPWVDFVLESATVAFDLWRFVKLIIECCAVQG